MTEAVDPLQFTGERFTPECVREIWYEHWHRYAFALSLARGKRVLDAACGEGYGSNLLAGVAAEVVGVDISDEAIAHARVRYQRDNLSFATGDAAALTFSDQRFDLIVSFETLEHLYEQEALVAGFARMLAPGGVLLISSPDKRTYSEIAGFRNEFHVRELYREELMSLLGAHFPEIRLYGQKLLFQSLLWDLDGDAQGAQALTAHAEQVTAGLAYEPLYFIAVCSREAVTTELPALSLFGDREESVYSHYNGEVRKNMQAGARIAELEGELARLRHSAISAPVPPPTRPWWKWW